MFPRWRAFAHAAVVLCALLATACRGGDKVEMPRLHTVYGVFDPALEHLPELGTPVAVRTGGRASQIVQFMGPIQPAWRQLLVEHGMTIRGYMPDDAFVVEATAADARWLATLPMVRSVSYEPRLWRLDPRLVVASSTPGGPPTIRQGVLDVAIELTDMGAKSQVMATLERLHGQVMDDGLAQPTGRVLHAHAPAAAIDELAADADVSAIEPFEAVHTTDDVRGGPDHIDVLRQDAVWSHGLRGEDQVVATCDVGVYTNACYFGGDKILDYENVTRFSEHNHDHGTHTAGIIAGDRRDNGRYDMADGTAPAAQLYIQDAGTGDTSEMSVPADSSSLFAPAYDAGVRIQSNAWSGDADAYGTRERSLDAFVAAHRDYLVVTSIGNGGDAPATVNSPATAKNVIAVGASSSAVPEDVSAFSAHGPTGDNRIKPTLVAPGEGIVAASGQSVCDIAQLTGTSMAASTVAGAAALVRQYYKEGFYPLGEARAASVMTPSAALIKATLLAGAEDMVGHGTGGPFPAQGQGFGRMHLDNALAFGAGARHLYVQDDQEGLAQNEAFTVLIEAQGGPLHIALTWSDEPAMAGAGIALVNDLDLELESADGIHYFGNQLDGGESVPTRAGDHTNVEEILYFANIKPGVYRLTVRAYNAPMAPQPYALVVSGNLGDKTGRDASHTDAP